MNALHGCSCGIASCLTAAEVSHHGGVQQKAFWLSSGFRRSRMSEDNTDGGSSYLSGQQRIAWLNAEWKRSMSGDTPLPVWPNEEDLERELVLCRDRIAVAEAKLKWEKAYLRCIERWEVSKSCTSVHSFLLTSARSGDQDAMEANGAAQEELIGDNTRASSSDQNGLARTRTAQDSPKEGSANSKRNRPTLRFLKREKSANDVTTGALLNLSCQISTSNSADSWSFLAAR